MQEAAAAALCARRLQTTSVVRREFYSQGLLVCQGLKSLLLLLLRDCGGFFFSQPQLLIKIVNSLREGVSGLNLKKKRSYFPSFRQGVRLRGNTSGSW